jgi:zinc/manganese transport system substrate-binding protein
MVTRIRAHRAAAAALAASLVLSACGTDEEPEAAPEEEQEPTDDLQVVATTSILGDVVENLLGEDGTVEVIMPPGSDPHGYEPSARDGAMLREADLVIANGLQLEENLLSALEAAEEDGVRVFEVAGRLDPIDFDWEGPHDHGHGDEDDDGPAHEDDDGHAHEDDDGHAHEDDGSDEGDGHSHEEDDGHSHDDEDDGHSHDDDQNGHGHDEDEDENGHGHDDEGDGHGHGPEDPHFWHDPIRMADAAHLIAAELADVSEVVDADEWEARARGYEEEILAVHEEVEQILAEVPDEHRKLITNHDSFGYLAARYDFEVLGTVVPGATTDAETNPGDFAELIQTLEEAQVPAIFSENIESDRLSEQLASEVLGRSDLEVEVIELFSDALGEPGSGGETYLGMLRTNAERIADGLA